MKKTMIVLVFAAAMAMSSCTKSGGSAYNGKAFTCQCSFRVLGRDTAVNYDFYGVTLDSATKACEVKNKWVKSISGTGGGYCHL